MGKESAREIAETLEGADTFIVISKKNGKANFSANGKVNEIGALFLAAIARFANEVTANKEEE